MQCLQQVAVPVGIYIAACYCGSSCQIWPEPEGLTPRAAHFSQNWCNLAPTGRFGTTGGTFVTFYTKLN